MCCFQRSEADLQDLSQEADILLFIGQRRFGLNCQAILTVFYIITDMNCQNRKVFPLPQRTQIYSIFQLRLNGQNIIKQTLAYDKVIQISSNYALSFLNKLLSQLHRSALFEGYVILKTQQKQSISHINRTKACSRVSQSDIFEQVISYRMNWIVMQQEIKYSKKNMQFEQTCNRIHHIIMYIMGKYTLESKVNFWLNKFKVELLRLNIPSPSKSNKNQIKTHSPIIDHSQQIQKKIQVMALESEHSQQSKRL